MFDETGAFLGVDFIISGAEVNDAGTEVNDELPANTAFFGQMTPDTGVDENGVNTAHPGFNPPGQGGILDDARFANGDFTADGYQIARVTVGTRRAASGQCARHCDQLGAGERNLSHPPLGGLS